jgi:hypothetical protein
VLRERSRLSGVFSVKYCVRNNNSAARAAAPDKQSHDLHSWSAQGGTGSICRFTSRHKRLIALEKLVVSAKCFVEYRLKG